MTVKQLIEELEKYPENMPVTINECMDFSESVGETIILSKKMYICFPYTDKDKFEYLNLEIADKEYWKIFDFMLNLCYNRM